MAWEARWGLKLASSNFTGSTFSCRNGVGGPLGIETQQGLPQPPHRTLGRKCVGGPLGIETCRYPNFCDCLCFVEMGWEARWGLKPLLCCCHDDLLFLSKWRGRPVGDCAPCHASQYPWHSQEE